MMSCILNKTFCAKFALASLIVIQLAACGGGSAGSSTSAATPTDLNSQTATTSATSEPSSTTSTTTTKTTTAATQFTIAGQVTGLSSGASLVLKDNGTDTLTINTAGAFTFGTAVTNNGSFLVTVAQQPNGQVCTVSNGSGTGLNANITNVNVICSDMTYTVSGTAVGLIAGQSVSVLNNGDNAQLISVNGVFTLNLPVAYGGGYALTIATQPVGQTCTLSNSTGSGVTANITNVALNCSSVSYTLSGAVYGMLIGQQVTLLNNGSDAQTVKGDGSFGFSVPVAYNGSYSVTVGTQPIGQTCTVSNGTGSGMVANVSAVNVTCSTHTYAVAGSVSGLSSGSVTLVNNGDVAHSVTVTASSPSFQFPVNVSYNGSYSVQVGTQPLGQTCSVTNGSGSGMTANISNVSVSCSAQSYTISGSVSGLTGQQQVTLLNNGGNATTVTAATGTFTFSTPVTYGSSYAVTVSASTSGLVCSVVSNGSSSSVVANVTNVSLNCSTTTYTIGGTVSGLAPGQQVTLLNNLGNAQTVTTNVGFTFTTPVSYSSSYAVTIGTQPNGQTCTVANGSGTSVVANVGNVSVVCATSLIYSPYFYYGDYNDSSNRLMTALTVNYPTTQTMLSVMPANLQAATWAFATGTCGSETWSGTSGAAFAAANVPAYVAAGKKYIVSTGGGGNTFFCTSGADFIKFVQTYYSANMIGVDFDIESTQTQSDVNNLVQSIVAAQSTYPNLRFSFTVASNGGTVPEIDLHGQWVLAAVKTYGLKNYTMNLMVFDYATSGTENSTICTLATGTSLCEMGQSAITAAKTLHTNWGVPYNQIELTAMIGASDNYDEVTTIADAATISKFALAYNLAGIHFWSFSRDKDCAASTSDNTASDTCNNYGKAGTLGYTNAFLADLGF